MVVEKKRSCCCGALPAMWWWLLTLLGLPLLFLLMLNARQGPIEKDIAGRAQAHLQDQGMDWAKVNLAGRGRDLLLQGEAPSDAERNRAAQLAQRIYGVRDVQNMLAVAAPAAVGLSEPVMADASQPSQVPATQEPAAVAPAVPAPASPEKPAAPAMPQAPLAAVAPPAPDAAAAPAAPVMPVEPPAPQQPAAPTAPDQGSLNQQQPAPTPAATAAAPEPSAEEQAVQDCQQQLNAAMTGKTILFETNKAAVKRDSVALLDSLVGIVSSCKGVIAGRGIQVSGHTDNVGNDAYNQKLSEQRAGAVKDYFVKQGVDAALVKSVGYGESKPVASNDNEAGRSQNRRITFEINPE